jgi:hypothetical protein
VDFGDRAQARAITPYWMPNELSSIYDLALPHCHTGCFPRQTRSATPRTRSENRLPDSCSNRGDASEATTPCFVFNPGKAPRFSLPSCRIGCIARDKGLKQSDRMGLVESFFLVVVQM